MPLDALSPPEPISTRIRRLRGDTGMTQRELGHLLGHPIATNGRSAHRITDWESGSAHPRINDLADLARALHTSTDYLLTGQATA